MPSISLPEGRVEYIRLGCQWSAGGEIGGQWTDYHRPLKVEDGGAFVPWLSISRWNENENRVGLAPIRVRNV